MTLYIAPVRALVGVNAIAMLFHTRKLFLVELDSLASFSLDWHLAARRDSSSSIDQHAADLFHVNTSDSTRPLEHALRHV